MKNTQVTKKKLIIRVVLACVALVAAVVTVLYAFGVFGGNANGKTNGKTQVYAFIKTYVVEDNLTAEESDFSFTASVDNTAGTFTMVITYGDDKVVSVRPYDTEKSGYLTSVTRSGKALRLSGINYDKNKTTVVYTLSGVGAVTIENFIVTKKQ